MATDPIRVKIKGLREFENALRLLGDKAPKELKQAGKKAAQLIVDDAKPRVPVGPGVGGHARDSIKVTSTGIQAYGRNYPYGPWLEFGGRVGIRRSVKRPFIKEGRYIFAAVDKKSDLVKDLIQAAIVDAAKAAGLDVK